MTSWELERILRREVPGFEAEVEMESDNIFAITFHQRGTQFGFTQIYGRGLFGPPLDPSVIGFIGEQVRSFFNFPLHKAWGKRKEKHMEKAISKGMKVGWTLKDGGGTGTGTVISDEMDGHVLVAVETITERGMTTTYEMKYIIWCTVTWLTPVAA